MKSSSPKPPRYNRYHVYLALSGVILISSWAFLRARKACGYALHGSAAWPRCNWSETWQWLQGSGSVEFGLLVLCGVALAILWAMIILSD